VPIGGCNDQIYISKSYTDGIVVFKCECWSVPQRWTRRISGKSNTEKLQWR